MVDKMRIAVLTSGGDAPGMNAAVRTIAVMGLAQGHEVLGVRHGYQGLLEGELTPLTLSEVNGISRQGGTILGSARSKVFPTEEGQAQAKKMLKKHEVDALIVLGGNGSLTGAHLLAKDRPCQIIGLPASIDNDIGHCGLSIGTDTAVNTIVEACDRISDTARAHRRAFIVEVMGRHSGFLAMRAGIAAEADAILYGEAKLDEDDIVDRLRAILQRSFAPGGYKTRALFIKAEGVEVPTKRLVKRLQYHLEKDAPDVDIRETILGHVVRGGRPSGLDRCIAQRLAFAAVSACEAGLHDVMLAWQSPEDAGQATQDPFVRIIPIADVLAETTKLLNGTSPVVQARIALLKKAENLLAL